MIGSRTGCRKRNEEARKTTEAEISGSGSKRPTMSENPDDYVRVGGELYCTGCGKQHDLHECSCGMTGPKAFILRHLRGRWAKNQKAAYDLHMLVKPNPLSLTPEGPDVVIIREILLRAKAADSQPATHEEDESGPGPFEQQVIGELLDEELENNRRLAAEKRRQLKQLGEGGPRSSGPKEVRPTQHKKRWAR